MNLTELRAVPERYAVAAGNRLDIAAFARQAGQTVDALAGLITSGHAPKPDASVGIQAYWLASTVANWIAKRRPAVSMNRIEAVPLLNFRT